MQKKTKILDAVNGAAVDFPGWGNEKVFENIGKAARQPTYSYAPYVSNRSSEPLA